MKTLDDQILEVENRIARRRLGVELTARAVWHRTVAKVVSPAGLLSAGAVGFLAVAAILRRRPKIVERRHGARASSKWGSIAGLVASGALTLMKQHYGGPVEMAQRVAAQVRRYKQRKASGGAAVAH